MLLSSFIGLYTFAQQPYSGVNSSIYGSIYNNISNPAEMMNRNNKFGIHLFSIDGNLSNNKIGYSLNLKKDYENFTSNDKSTPNTLLQNDINQTVNTDILGPAAFLKIGKNTAIGFNTRMRTMAYANEIDAKIIQNFISDFTPNSLINYPEIDVKNMNLRANSFNEIGVSVARNIVKTKKHTLNIGATAKYVMGAFSSRVGFNNFTGNINIEETNGDLILVTQGSGEFITEYSGIADINQKLSIGNLFGNSTSTIAFDLGAVYEFRKDYCEDCKNSTYDAKISFSITDIGSLKYKASINSFRYFLNTDNKEIRINLSDLKNSLESYPNLISSENLEGRSFSSALPTMMQWGADVRVWRRFYINLSSRLNITKNQQSIYNSFYLNTLTITPKIEKKHWGAYVPITNVANMGSTIGAVFRYGPLVVGSNSIFSNLPSKNAKNLNLFLGFNIIW